MFLWPFWSRTASAILVNSHLRNISVKLIKNHMQWFSILYFLIFSKLPYLKATTPNVFSDESTTLFSIATSCWLCEYNGMMCPGMSIVPGRVTKGSSTSVLSSRIVRPLISSRSVPRYWKSISVDFRYFFTIYVWQLHIMWVMGCGQKITQRSSSKAFFKTFVHNDCYMLILTTVLPTMWSVFPRTISQHHKRHISIELF